MPNYNLHLHTIFSDGSMPAEDYVQQAIALGFCSLGFTEHSPLAFDNPFSLKAEDIESYISTLEDLKEKYRDKILLFRGLEMDYIQGMSDDFNHCKEQVKTDYLIGSVHLVKATHSDELWFTDGPKYETYDKGLQKFFQGDIRQGVKAFFNQTNEMISTQHFDVLGHFDKIKMHNRNRYFTEDESWYQNLIDETLDLVKEKGLIVEINTRGIYKKRSPHLFPDGQALQKLKARNIHIIISSDAHHPSELNAGFSETTQRLLEIGFTTVMEFDGISWLERPLD